MTLAAALAKGSGGEASEGKVITGATVQRLIDEIRVAAEYFKKDSAMRRLAGAKIAALTPLVGLPGFTTKEALGCFRKGQSFLLDLREASKEMR